MTSGAMWVNSSLLPGLLSGTAAPPSAETRQAPDTAEGEYMITPSSPQLAPPNPSPGRTLTMVWVSPSAREVFEHIQAGPKFRILAAVLHQGGFIHHRPPAGIDQDGVFFHQRQALGIY